MKSFKEIIEESKRIDEEMAELLYFREEIFNLNRFKEEASRNISSIMTELKIEEGYEEEANAY